MNNKRLNTGYVRTVLSKRGSGIPDDEALRSLLGVLDGESNQVLGDALRRLSNGTETTEDCELAEGLRFAASEETLRKFGECGHDGIGAARAFRYWRDGGRAKLLDDALTNADSAERLETLLVKQTEAGAVDGNGASQPGALPHEAQGRPDRPPRASRSGKWTDGDRAKSFAREEPSVAALPAAAHRVYTNKAAAKFEIDLLRTPEERRRYTVRIEGANREGSTGSANWTEKVIVQLDARELHQAAAVFFGASPSFEARNHGDQRDKSVSLTQQPGGILLKLSMSGRQVLVPLEADSLYKIALVFARALHLNDSDFDPSFLVSTLRAVSAISMKKRSA